MSSQTRRRACEACQIQKARCEHNLSSHLEASKCERCFRLGRDCVPAPRKLQRDRIAELEAQVQELSKALKEQHGSSTGTSTIRQQSGVYANDPTAGDTASSREGETKKRKLSNQLTTTITANSPALNAIKRETSGILGFIDSKVSYSEQDRAVNLYICGHMRLLPLVALSNRSLDHLRQGQPLLLLCILAYAVSGVLPSSIQSQLSIRATEEFSTQIVASGFKSIELVQCLLIACFYYRLRPDFKGATVLQLVSLAQGMAIDLGFAGESIARDPGVQPPDVRDFLPENATWTESMRAWLACFVATSAVTTVMRRLDAGPWTPYLDECLEMLEAFPILESDLMLCQVVKAERLVHKVVKTLALNDASYPLNWTDVTTQTAVSSLRLEIDAWADSNPANLSSPMLNIWKHVALIYLNEPVLHTSTNRSSFSAPYADKVEASDFASPVVTVSHVASLYALKGACHAVLDTAVEIGPDSLLAVSSLFYTPRIAYALFILLKLYVCVTAPGNTYGAVLDRSELKLEHYFLNLKVLSQTMLEVDGGSFNSRIMACCGPFETWFVQYAGIVAQYESNYKPVVHRGMLDIGLIHDLTVAKGSAATPVLEVDDAWLDELLLRAT